MLFALASQFIAVDVGTQYMKFAESTFDGEPRMMRDGTNREIMPAAAAFRSKTLHNPMIGDDFNADFRIGKAAEKLLKHNDTLGMKFIPSYFSRNVSTNSSAPVNALFGALIAERLKDSTISTGVTFVVPYWWTFNMRNALMSTCTDYGIPVSTIFDDTGALALNYGVSRLSRFMESPKHVLFVDIGASSAKVYGYYFYWNETASIAYSAETVADWTEDFGGEQLIRSYANATNTTYKVAMNALRQDPDTTLISEDIYRVLKLVKSATSTAVGIAETEYGHKPEVDELQLIGGASQYRWLTRMIKDIVNPKTMKRDFNAQEALAIGGVYGAMFYEGTCPYNEVHHNPRPTMSIDLICQERQKFCQRGTACRPTLSEYESLGCQEATLVANPAQIPRGADPVLTRYLLRNLSNFHLTKEQHPIGYFDMRNMPPGIEQVTYCIGDECRPITIEEDRTDPLDVVTAREFSRKLVNAWDAKNKKAKLTHQILFAAEKVPDTADDETKAIIEAVRDGQLPSMTYEELLEINSTLARAVKQSKENEQQEL